MPELIEPRLGRRKRNDFVWSTSWEHRTLEIKNVGRDSALDVSFIVTVNGQRRVVVQEEVHFEGSITLDLAREAGEASVAAEQRSQRTGGVLVTFGSVSVQLRVLWRTPSGTWRVDEP